MTAILICTVGGSAEPVLTALRELAPDHVVFVCTGPDPGTGRPGSGLQITGGGRSVKASADDPKPRLTSIPAEAGLAADRFEVLEIPGDDLDVAFAALDARLRALRERFPEARLVADYTGGTKTMSAALVAAALERPDVELQLVTGNRTNLVRVLEGTQYAAPASVDGVRIGRAIGAHVAAWARFAYDEAARGLAQVPAPSMGTLRARLNRARDLSVAFAAWDRFDHREALRLLEPYASRLGQSLGLHLQALRVLASGDAERGGEPARRREGLLIWDLWLNAQRRAMAGRYDDAVARIYRVIEWTAQWVLRTQAGIDTADVARERLPASLALAPGRDGRYRVGLFAAWQLVEAHTGGPAAVFFREHREALLAALERRNVSILAHGFEPIGGADWKAIEALVAERFAPMLETELAAAGVRRAFPQLPDAYLRDAE